MENLPDSYDLIVVGTGMPECIVAAAAARIGKSVLHMDRNNFYGGLWASFNFESLTQWINQKQDGSSQSTHRFLEASWLEQLKDSENLVLCPKSSDLVTELVQKSYLSVNEVLPDESPSRATPQDDPLMVSEESETADESPDEDEQEILLRNFAENNVDDLSSRECASENASETEAMGVEPCDDNVPEAEIASSEEASNALERSVDPIVAPVSQPFVETAPEPATTVWTMEALMLKRHKFNIDISPKLLFSRGALVELLISSNTSRYAEFQGVNRILTYINEHLEQVPCSRADVFSTKNVNVVEKRMLMKLLTFCLDYQKYPEEYRGYEGRPFLEFLRSRKTTPNIEHYILHAIAMVDESCLTLQGLQATQKFMESLGRFGNSPFLWTCYGSAELPQCFCRLCAVFGGIYYLGREADAVVLDSNNHCAGIISNGSKLKCSSLVMEYSYMPSQFLPTDPPEMISRAILITTASILTAERHQNTLLRLPPVPGVRNAITVLEFGSLSFVSPENLYVVHMTCKPLGESVVGDFKLAVEELFLPLDEEEKDVKGEKPRVLWSLYFRQLDTTTVDVNSVAPEGVYVTSSPGLHLDYDHAVAEARAIFQKMYPDEEFLPRAPDPEDIVMEEHSNPGPEDVKVEEVKVTKVEEAQCSVGEGDATSPDDEFEKSIETAVEAMES